MSVEFFKNFNIYFEVKMDVVWWKEHNDEDETRSKEDKNLQSSDLKR